MDLDLERAARLLPFKPKALFRMSALIYLSGGVVIQTQPESQRGTPPARLAGPTEEKGGGGSAVR